MLELTYSQVAIVLVAYFFAAMTKGLTGLGFSSTCLPIIVFALGLKEALPLVIIPSIYSNLIVMRQVGHFKEAVFRFWPMLLATLPGLAVGLWVLTWIDGDLAGAVFGLVLLLWCAFSFAKPDLHLAPNLERPLSPFSGFLTGINCSFTMSSLVMAIGLGQLGFYSLDDAVISIFGIVLVIIGVKVGGAIRDHLSEKLFHHAILTMLTIMGLSLILPILNS